jgi:hypothetical protein
MAQQKGNGAGVTEFASSNLIVKDNLKAIKIDAGFDLITEDDSTREAVERILQLTQPLMYQLVVEDGSQQLVNAQTQANYNGVGDNGGFSGGTGHANGDVITVGVANIVANVTVTANAAGVVTTFTVDSSDAEDVPSEGDTLSQISTDGGGINFSLTVGGNNLVGGGGVIHAIVDGSQFDAGSLQNQIRAIGTDNVNGKNFSSATVVLGTGITVSSVS